MKSSGAQLSLPADVLGADALTARRAREQIHEFLADASTHVALDPQVIDDVLLAVSELVTNAVVHAGEAPAVSVRIEADQTIRVEIVDHDTRVPSVQADRRGRVGGHGLRIVQAIASRWGVEPHAVAGKTVWAVFGAATSRRSRIRPTFH